jgi:hypothetical protein
MERAGGRCECEGECGLHDGRDLLDRQAHRCVEQHGQPGKFAKGKIVLTIAHLCHRKKCARRKHLKAMCQRCHLRYDIHLHVAHRKRNAASNPTTKGGEM